jgi:hypothetical protein
MTISTLTHRVAAIEVKMLHLQFRMKKIYEDQQKLNNEKINYQTPRDLIKGMNNAAYNCIDMLVTFEHIYQLINDIFGTPELKEKFTKEMFQLLGNIRKIAEKWKPVRNKLGGHIDIEVAEKFCKEHNYFGVFLSEDLEADTGMLNMLLIESAINIARDKSDIFGRDLNLKNNGIGKEIKLFVDKLNEDWNTIFSYFDPMMKFLYEHGKQEKKDCTNPKDWKGIIVD